MPLCLLLFTRARKCQSVPATQQDDPVRGQLNKLETVTRPSSSFLPYLPAGSLAGGVAVMAAPIHFFSLAGRRRRRRHHLGPSATRHDAGPHHAPAPPSRLGSHRGERSPTSEVTAVPPPGGQALRLLPAPRRHASIPSLADERRTTTTRCAGLPQRPASRPPARGAASLPQPPAGPSPPPLLGRCDWEFGSLPLSLLRV